jgi:pectinesterase
MTAAVECLNRAANGRSSKSFIEEGRWRKALALKGTHYLIQFGHNDEPGKGPERETDPDTTYRQYISRYIDEARAIGATPVLVTSLTRRRFDETGRIVPNIVPYVEAVRALAAEKRVPLIDLHDRSVAAAELMGRLSAACAARALGSVPSFRPRGAAHLVHVVDLQHWAIEPQQDKAVHST